MKKQPTTKLLIQGLNLIGYIGNIFWTTITMKNTKSMVKTNQNSTHNARQRKKSMKPEKCPNDEAEIPK